MSKSTGPIIAVGAITMVNSSIFHGRPVDWRIPVATALTGGMLALAERGWESGAVALSYLALFAVVMVRLQPDVPSPAETALEFFNGKVL